jgi:putative membrane protein
MKRWKYALMTLCFAAATAACADDRSPNADRPAEPAAGTPGAAGTSGTAAKDAGPLDRNFVNDMIADNYAELELARLAQTKATDRRVKEFAAVMIRDHQKTDAELKTVATQANVDTSDADMNEFKDAHDRLAKLSGGEFDREYIKQMVDDHENAVNEAEDKADGGGNDHIKQWAAKSLPTLKKHLEQAKEIQTSLEKRAQS